MIQVWRSHVPEVGIYKRKQESKKTRNQELDQESDQENKKTREKTTTRPRKKENLDHYDYKSQGLESVPSYAKVSL